MKMMGRTVFSFPLCLLVAVCTWRWVTGMYCSVDQGKPGDPSLPKMNTTAFIVDYQINIIDHQYTMWAREEYDYVANKATMTMLRDGIEEGIIMDYNDNLIASYYYGEAAKTTYSCTIDRLNTSKSDNFNLFGGRVSGSKSMPHIYSSRDVLSFGGSLGEKYMGRTTIDGIDVDHWQSCMNWADDMDNFTLDYYFTTTTSNWSSGANADHTQIPLRAVMKGVKNDNSGQPYTLNHIYEYLNFRTYASLSEEVFALPTGMKCKDVNNLRTKPMPDLPRRMSYHLEVVNTDVMTMDVFYDEDKRLVRSVKDGVKSIDDFNTGVHYSIDEITNQCNVRPISTEEDFSAGGNTSMVTMKNRKELFYLDGVFTYTGSIYVRGIKCDAWARTLVSGGISSNVEVYFSVTGENYSTNTGQQLVSLDISTQDIAITYNLFNLLPSPDISRNPFDISICRNASTIREFRMVVAYQGTGLFKDDTFHSLIHESLWTKTAAVTGLSLLLVQWTDLDVDDENSQLHWFGNLLTPDPVLDEAPIAIPSTLVSLDRAWTDLQDSVNFGEFTTSVELPSGSVNLTAIEVYIVQTDIDFTATGDDALDHFSGPRHSIPKSFTSDENLRAENALDCANICLETKLLDCRSFAYCTVSDLCQVSSDYPTKNSSYSPFSCEYYSRDYTSDFVKVPGTVLEHGDENWSASTESVQTCATMCLQESDFTCESFDYCVSNKGCYLNRKHYFETSSSKKAASLCDHYSKDYISDYAKSYGNMFTAQILLQNLMLSVADTSPKQCAYICSKGVSDCSKFSYCSSTQQCMLISDVSAKGNMTEQNDDCDVYTVFPSGMSTRSKSDDNGETYTAGAMAGLGIAMTCIGAFSCLVLVLLLRHFKVWNVF